MIKGVIMGISFAFLFVSTFIIGYNMINGIPQASYTAAVVGTDRAISYAIIVFIVSLLIFASVIIMIKRKQQKAQQLSKKQIVPTIQNQQPNTVINAAYQNV